MQTSDLVRHRRIPFPSPIAGRWRLDCTCGHRTEIAVDSVRSIVERDAALDVGFVDHIPAGERRRYVLVNQRGEGPPDPADEDRNQPVGNFIMPEGTPCAIVRWWESDGFYWAMVEPIDRNGGQFEYLVGEIRTADGRVFRVE